MTYLVRFVITDTRSFDVIIDGVHPDDDKQALLRNFSVANELRRNKEITEVKFYRHISDFTTTVR